MSFFTAPGFAAFALVLALRGCSADVTAAPTDSGVPDSGPTDASSGVCCPRADIAVLPSTCDGVSVGGYVDDMAQCPTRIIWDAPKPCFTEAVDSHGCPIWNTYVSGVNCSCLPGPLDAGADDAGL